MTLKDQVQQIKTAMKDKPYNHIFSMIEPMLGRITDPMTLCYELDKIRVKILEIQNQLWPLISQNTLEPQEAAEINEFTMAVDVFWVEHEMRTKFVQDARKQAARPEVRKAYVGSLNEINPFVKFFDDMSNLHVSSDIAWFLFNFWDDKPVPELDEVEA